MAYTSISNGQVDLDSPVDQTLMTALRDNPIEIALGSTGAPRILGRALNVFNSSGSATLTASTTSTILTVTNLGNINYVLLTGTLLCTPAGGGGAATAEVRFSTSTDGGSSWGTEFVVAEATDIRVAVCYTLDVSGSVNALRLRINGTIAVGAEATAQVQILNMGGA